MSRYRLVPTPAQETALLGHCGHARYVWNLGLEQRLMWRPGRPPTPGRRGAGPASMRGSGSSGHKPNGSSG
ncbi:helix-turn-helix domain-containing protein [Kribbella sp. NBC_01245]